MNTHANYKTTIYACFTGYVVQAVVNNFVPLLFLTFQSGYGIPLSKITLLVTFNFGLQLIIDMLSAGFIDRIGYRASAVIAHICCAAGLLSLTVLPDVFADPFYGLLASVMIYAVGGGLIEVLISPIMESCPTDNKEKAISLLHSFYCWGHVGVVLLSTLYFALFGAAHFKPLAALWAVIPLVNALLFLKVPMAPLIAEGERGLTLAELLKRKVFWLMFLLMLCAGACEQSVSQWASTLAEKGLGVSKAMGDLAGPMLFAVMMGISRAIYGKYGEKIKLELFMLGSGVLCLLSYLLIAFAPHPAFGFVGCALCGLSVGILWPGTFSMTAATIKSGGTIMFALLALAGDLGCAGGPTFVGLVAGAAGDSLQTGILAAVLFPVLLITGLLPAMRFARRMRA